MTHKMEIPSPQPLSFLNTTARLSETERSHLETLSQFLKNEIEPDIYKNFNEGQSPKAFLKFLGEHQWLGTSLPFPGSSAHSDLFYGLLLYTIESTDSGLRSLVSVHSSLAMYAIYRFASETKKSELLSPLQKNELTACFALTEPKHGSDPASMETFITERNGKSYLNGEKHWVTNALDSQVMVVWFKDKDSYRGAIIDPQSPGVEIKPMPEMMSLRLSPSYHLTFKDVEVPKENFLEVEGLRGPLSCLNNARWGVSWGALGAASACFSEALKHTQERKQFGQPLAQNQLVQEKLVEMWTQIQLGISYMLHLSELKENKTLTPQQVSLAKLHHVSQSLEVARQARDLLGGVGVTQKFHTFRHMVNLESVNTYEGTMNIHKLILGQYLTKLAAFTNSTN